MLNDLQLIRRLREQMPVKVSTAAGSDHGDDFVYAVIVSSTARTLTGLGSTCSLHLDADVVEFCRSQIAASYADSFVYPVVQQQGATSSGSSSNSSLELTLDADVIRHDSCIVFKKIKRL